MTTDDLFARSHKSNIPELSVSDLARGIQSTLENTFGRVRVRGELTGLKLASSGHLYGDIKDEDAVINLICWRSSVPKLSVKPEDGMDVIVTGRISSYPKSSRYQIIIDHLELAGQGALLKLLDDRRKKLAAEGLFDPEKKKSLPFLPDIIGVVTSPTGAVLRDIMHRLDERFPRRVWLWPVAVQGVGSAEQIAAAIRGFNQLPRKPDVIIVARGGGSLEDLMAFNEEIVVRAVFESHVPVISAVGHETDTTLIDYVADQRAPTPTAAAEMAVPRRDDLWAFVQDMSHRYAQTLHRQYRESRQTLLSLSARMGDPLRLLDIKTQRLDIALASLRHPREKLAQMHERLTYRGERLLQLRTHLFDRWQSALAGQGALLESYSFHRILDRGFAVVRDAKGRPITRAEQALPGMTIDIEFAGAKKIGAIVQNPIKNAS